MFKIKRTLNNKPSDMHFQFQLQRKKRKKIKLNYYKNKYIPIVLSVRIKIIKGINDGLVK